VSKLLVIVGSTRPGRAADLVLPWVTSRLKQADAYVVVTPEYNHSIPAVLKNAIDTVWLSFGFRNKPVAAVGYSGSIGAGIRAIEHLAHVFIEAEAVRSCSGLTPTKGENS
jgi:NAD(P)H-dependent FMN reductase